MSDERSCNNDDIIGKAVIELLQLSAKGFIKIALDGLCKIQLFIMSEFQQFRRKQIAELRPFQEGEQLSSKVSVSQADKDAGSPKVGDMIARNPKNHEDQWLVAKQYFEDNFESVN